MSTLKGRKQSPEHIAARSAALKGRVAWNKGQSPSEETRQRQSVQLRGRAAWNKGKRWRKSNGRGVGSNNSRWQPDRSLVRARLKVARFMRDCIRRMLVNKKSCSALTLGYSKDDLIRHLEAQFTDDMNWGNYGTFWEIDHIRPIAKFVSSGELEPAIVNAMTNLRPLTCSANRARK